MLIMLVYKDTHTLVMNVPTALPIKSFVERNVHKGEKVLMRYNKRTAERLSVELDPEDRAASLRRIKDFFDNYRLPEGVSFDADEEVRQVRGQQEEFLLAALLGSDKQSATLLFSLPSPIALLSVAFQFASSIGFEETNAFARNKYKH